MFRAYQAVQHARRNGLNVMRLNRAVFNANGEAWSVKDIRKTTSGNHSERRKPKSCEVHREGVLLQIYHLRRRSSSVSKIRSTHSMLLERLQPWRVHKNVVGKCPTITAALIRGCRVFGQNLPSHLMRIPSSTLMSMGLWRAPRYHHLPTTMHKISNLTFHWTTKWVEAIN